jgi:hypothetical protein
MVFQLYKISGGFLKLQVEKFDCNGDKGLKHFRSNSDMRLHCTKLISRLYYYPYR